MRTPEPGRSASATHIVGPDDNAVAFGSGDVDVLATPRLVAWLEAATVAVAGSDEASTSVGTRVEIDHLSPSAVGSEVTVRATLERVDGRRLHFAAEAVDADGAVAARARIVRVIVDRARFDAST